MARTIIIYIVIALLSPGVIAFSQQNEKGWQWTQQIGGPGYDATSGIVIDKENTIYIAGSFTTHIKDKKKDISSSGKYDLFVAAYQNNGREKWIWTAGGEQTDRINAISLLPEKKVAIAGTISPATSLGNKKSNTEGKQLFIAALDEKGKTDWLRTLTYTKSAALFLLESDKEGNLYACGTFTDSLRVEGKYLVSRGKRDIFLLSLNEKGGLKAFKSIGSKSDEMPSAITIDTSGNVILGGSFSSDIVIDTQQLKAVRKEISKNIFLLTFSPELEAIASESYNSQQYLNLKALKVDGLNRLYMAGNFVSDLDMHDKKLESHGQSDVYLGQFSSEGELRWLKQFGSKKMDYAGDLAIDRLNGVILTGAMNDTIQSDSINIAFRGAYSNAFAVQFSDDGTTLWGEQLPGEGNNVSYHAALDSRGDLYLSGLFSNTMESESNELTSYGQKDVFVAKFTNCQRDEKAIEGNDVLCPGEELLLSTGIKYREIVWNDTIENTKSITVETPGEYWVYIIDEKGCSLADTLEILLAELPEPELGNDTIVDVNESITLQPAGSYVQYLWQDNSADSVFTGEAVDKEPCIEQYHVMVLDSNACVGADTIEVTYIDQYPWLNLNENSQLAVFPNPVKEILTWQLETEEAGKLEVDITSATGKKLYAETIKNYQPGQEMKVNMQNYKPGVYFLGVTDGQNRINVSITHD